MIRSIGATLVICIVMLSAIAVNGEDQPRAKTTDGKFIFPASKGDVVFDHNMHQQRMEAEGCIPCHKTNNPTITAVRPRFEERIAHYFCRGCHHEKGRGPTECPQCHKLNPRG